MHMLRLLLTVALIGVPAAVTADVKPAAPPGSNPATWNGGPRVRPNDNRSAAILLDGIRRSATFRSIIEKLESHDVIAYVEIQPSLKGRLAGGLTWLSGTRRFRYVRIGISPDLRGDAAIACLGHELRHALEVAGEPSIVDENSLTEHYRHVGISVTVHNNGWDTEAARQAGDDVRRDLVASGMRATESVRDFDPDTWHVLYRKARGVL